MIAMNHYPHGLTCFIPCRMAMRTEAWVQVLGTPLSLSEEQRLKAFEAGW